MPYTKKDRQQYGVQYALAGIVTTIIVYGVWINVTDEYIRRTICCRLRFAAAGCFAECCFTLFEVIKVTHMLFMMHYTDICKRK